MTKAITRRPHLAGKVSSIKGEANLGKPTPGFSEIAARQTPTTLADRRDQHGRAWPEGLRASSRNVASARPC